MHLRGSASVPSELIVSPVSMERDKSEGHSRAMQADEIQLHGAVNASDSKLHAFRPRSRPPSREELQSSMAEQGIPGILHQGIFYGNPADVPERPIGRPSRHLPM